MTERAAMLAAIIADPADDTVRLAMADWFQEHGEPERAEFIRRQIAMVGGGNRLVAFDCRPFVLEHTPPSPQRDIMRDLSEMGVEGGCFVRGFVESVALPAADWLAHGDALHWHPDCGRKCPETAQPVARVRLTSWPSIIPDGSGQARLGGRGQWRVVGELPGYHDGRGGMAGPLLRAEWPGIAFELPVLPDVRSLRAGLRARVNGDGTVTLGSRRASATYHGPAWAEDESEETPADG